jgi:hypothetical protein
VVQGVLDIPQLTARQREAKPLLPSFLYLPHESELTEAERACPARRQDFITGEFARSRGAATPIRLVSSAKSWLCHPGVDRRAAFCRRCARGSQPHLAADRLHPLPGAPALGLGAGPPRGPVCPAGHHRHHPASFDPAARELTAEACKAAGFAG